CLLLRRLKSASDAHSVRLMFLLQYGGGHIAQRDREPDFAKRVVECATAAGIETIDTWPSLKAVLKEQGVDGLKEFYVMHDNNRAYGHMSVAGNRHVAGLLAQQVRAHD